jgi:pyruvate kinase
MIKLIATIGPSSNKPEVLRKLADRGVSFFRINLSHTDTEEIEQRILDIKNFNVPIILDTEGSQIRTGNREEIEFLEGDTIKLYNKEIKCDGKNLFLTPLDCIEKLREGDLIFIDFNSLLLKVIDVSQVDSKGFITCHVMIGAKAGGRKAVYVDSPTFKLPAFSKKDRFAMELAKKHNINHFTLSFMESYKDVNEFKKINPNVKVYSKIESKKGLEEFKEIARVSDGILIDRGDLSSQVPIEKIPFIQKYIIEKVRKMNKEVFVATNTLEQMAFSLKPNRAEVNDIINTILDGATGIALTKEVAVGKYPVEVVNMALNLINQTKFVGNDKDNISKNIDKLNYLSNEVGPDLLIKPHGGILVDRVLSNYNEEIPVKSIDIDYETLMDLEQISIGSFSPLEGFMNSKDFHSVLSHMRLSNGVVWPLPIILQVSQQEAENIKEDDKIALRYKLDGDIYGIIEVEEVYKINKKDCAKKIFGVDDIEHPGVKRFIDKGEYLIGGRVNLIKRRNSEYKTYELTPKQTRRIFSERGWSKVLGFHTRNIIHRSHEFVQRKGLEISNCDGLFIHPVIGKKKVGDFEAEVIMRSYEKMIELFYTHSRVVLCSFASYSRYCGPREALFTALVRKNFGCSHFIVGRDHTGVGNYYGPQDSHKVFDKFTEEELGIKPIKFDKVSFSKRKNDYILEEDNHPEEDKLEISGTKAREMLKRGEKLPDWFIREEIYEVIDKIKKEGKKIFVE